MTADYETAGYRIIGAEESPYSVKVRAYLRYKQLPHQWLSRAEAPELYRQHAKLPLIPLVITPGDQALQDSTPIITTIEARHPESSIYPSDPVCNFISALMEEFADEWGNKWMFHYRWAREADQLACSRRLAELMALGQDEQTLAEAARTIRARMVDRVWFVGSSAETAQQIEDSFKDTLALLEPHLAQRPYLFGQQPAFADFALWGQLYNAHRDPTPRKIIEHQAPNTLAWIKRMESPVSHGDFEAWSTLSSTLKPLLIDQVAGLFLPWSDANHRAIAEQAESFTVVLRSGQWSQKPQKYHARSLQALRAQYQEITSNKLLDQVLDECRCLKFLSE
jgi:glutathione S-transferase